MLYGPFVTHVESVSAVTLNFLLFQGVTCFVFAFNLRNLQTVHQSD